jgi:uncharacterized membrane protein
MIWIGGMITVGALVPALRSADIQRSQLRAMARRFGVVAWVAMVTSIVTGIIQIARLDVDLEATLAIKIILVGIAVSVALVHQQAASHVGPALRGAMEGASLLIGLAILAASVAV